MNKKVITQSKVNQLIKDLMKTPNTNKISKFLKLFLQSLNLDENLEEKQVK